MTDITFASIFCCPMFEDLGQSKEESTYKTLDEVLVTLLIMVKL